jgi:hypothetical protein
MEAKEAVVLVAERGKQAVGFSMAMIREYPPVLETRRHGFIQDVIVTERLHRRRSGIGRDFKTPSSVWRSTSSSGGLGRAN